MNQDNLELFPSKDTHYIDFCNEIAMNVSFIEDYNLIYKIGVLYDLHHISHSDIKILIYDELNKEIQQITDNPWIIKRLLETAFIFANIDTDKNSSYLSEDKKQEMIEEIDKIKNKAYRIAISIFYYWKFLKEGWFSQNSLFDNNLIIYRLFTRLWILSKSRDLLTENDDIFSIDIYGKMEAINKEMRNKFSIKDELSKIPNYIPSSVYWIDIQDDFVLLSDFQNRVMTQLFWYRTSQWEGIGKSMAISAPTSAWKTFILKNYIIYKLLESSVIDRSINIAFVVPSKALLNELKSDFIELFNQYNLDPNKFSIHSHVSWDDFIKNFLWKKNLFIVTQERLNYLYNDIKCKEQGAKFLFDIVVVDEAHKVWYWYRWTLLSYIISKIKLDNSSVQIVLLAPMLSKLHKFKKEFWLNSLDEEFSNFWLVAKNAIRVSSKRIQKYEHDISFFLLIHWKEEHLFTYKYFVEEHLKEDKFKFTEDKKLSVISRLFTNDSSQSIIFRVSPESVKNQIQLIRNWIYKTELVYTDLSRYLWEILPESFDLYENLVRWLAYHNWQLPISIKSAIEKDFKNWKIQFLCANYTVLEWVNLPAKNIFIWNRDLESKILEMLDIKNLMWRSWRLNFHLNGNVFFLNTKADSEKLPNEDNNLVDLQGNIPNILDDYIMADDNRTKFDRFLEYISPSYKYKAIVQYGSFAELWFLRDEKMDFEYMTWYLLSKYLDFYQENAKEYSFIIEMWKTIYPNWDENMGKLEKMDSYIKSIANDIISRTSNDFELFNIIQKNIFIDPRKQLDFYIDVKLGDNLFLLENIRNFSDILKIFNNTEILEKEMQTYWELEFERVITKKSESLQRIICDIQKYFIDKYQMITRSQHYSEYYIWNNCYDGTDKISGLLNQWISSISLKNILWNRDWGGVTETLALINNDILFTYLNAFTIYFELANLAYSKYSLSLNESDFEEDNSRLDTNFIYYLEMGTFYPNLVYLISKWVSRESAIWLKDNKIIQLYPFESWAEKLYFEEKKNHIFAELDKKNMLIIKDELERLIYTY